MGKEKSINFKIEEEAKVLFEEYCKKHHTTPSQVLRLFVHQKIKLLKLKKV